MAPLDLELPRGFRLGLGWTVLRRRCEHQWRVPEGQRERLSEAAVKLLVGHRRGHRPPRKPREQVERVEAYCPICREERRVKVPDGKHWGQCEVCGTAVGTGYA